jgi:ABC-type nitrate/sulfonate/bicarbonate transport system substrate-binding protein
MSVDTLWYTRCPVPTAFSIAARDGSLEAEFAEDGIAVRSLAASTDPSVRQSHFEHTQRNSFRHGGNIPPLVARSRGADLRLIALSWSDYSFRVLALPESGIQTASDLAGRRLSLPRRVNDSVDFWRATVLRGYSSALASVGLTLEDVELVDLEIERSYVSGASTASVQNSSLWGPQFMLGFQREEAAALVRGEVDAIFTEGAFSVAQTAALGATVVIDVGRLPLHEQRVNNALPLAFTASGELIDERPDLVARWLAVSLAAADWAVVHPEETRRVIAAETGLAEELVPQAQSPDVHLQLGLDLSPEHLAALQSQHDLLLAHGFLAGPVDFDAFVDPAPLRAARDLLAAGVA